MGHSWKVLVSELQTNTSVFSTTYFLRAVYYGSVPTIILYGKSKIETKAMRN